MASRDQKAVIPLKCSDGADFTRTCDCRKGVCGATLHYQIITQKVKIMKGKYITTSLLIAIMASEKAAQSINVAETPASTKGHAILWSKDLPNAAEIAARLKGRDELKFS
jgi:hypothetical protein